MSLSPYIIIMDERNKMGDKAFHSISEYRLENGVVLTEACYETLPLMVMTAEHVYKRTNIMTNFRDIRKHISRENCEKARILYIIQTVLFWSSLC